MNFRSLYPVGIAAIAAPLAGLFAGVTLRAQSDDGEFKPIVEAEMPKDFPQYTPVGDVRIKRYPAYRRAEAKAGSGSQFWTLFTHIKRNNIAMTAPVEMSYTDGDRPSEKAMSFLYGRDDVGEPGHQGDVEVIDVPSMVVVSTGIRGPRTSEAVAKAGDRLNAWLI